MKITPAIMSHQHKQTGMTLVEIMIALLIGAFLVGGIIQVYINTKKTYRITEALSRLQDNGRFAMDIIGRDIRMASYRECLTDPAIKSPIGGTNGNEASTPDAKDTLNLGWATTACPTGAPGDADQNVSYSVNNKLNLEREGEELVDGVENIQVLYGIDTNEDDIPNYYRPAFATAADTNWKLVKNIRVSLLLRTVEDNITEAPLSYTFNDETVATPPDRRVRRVFTSTFAVRNLIP